MRLVTVDLDDTLMRCGFDYTAAKDEFGEFVAAQADIGATEAVATMEEYDKKNIEKFGLAKERLPNSFEDGFRHLIDEPSEEDIAEVRRIANTVFKTEEEYAERGFMEGAEEVLQTLQNQDVHLHLITAGDETVQQQKIDGLRLERYFDGTHIVPIDSKQDRIAELMNTHGVEADKAYHVGNSLTSDVKAALEAGVQAVYVPMHEWRSVDDAEYYRTHEDVHIYDDIGDLSTTPAPFFEQSSPSASD